MDEPNASSTASKPEKKPVIELLQDIHTQAGFPRGEPRHFLNPKRMNRTLFSLALFFILFSVVFMLLMIWGFISPALGLRSIASAGVILVAAVLLRALNDSLVE